MKPGLVFRLRNKHLGDNWTTIGYLLALSARWKRPVHVDRKAVTFNGEVWQPEELAQRIASFFESEGRLEFTDHPGDPVDEIFVKVGWRMSFPTRIPWRRGSHVCVQFGGSWMAHRKNIPEPEALALLHGLLDLGYEVIPLGLPMTLERAVELLTTCQFFVGIDSAFMHIANSIGCPRFLVRNAMPWVDEVHHGRQWFGCDSALICLEHIRRHEFPTPGIWR